MDKSLPKSTISNRRRYNYNHFTNIKITRKRTEINYNIIKSKRFNKDTMAGEMNKESRSSRRLELNGFSLIISDI